MIGVCELKQDAKKLMELMNVRIRPTGYHYMIRNKDYLMAHK